MAMKRHSEDFIKKIFQLSRERGLSARQIAEVMSPEYRDYNGVDMTRNSVISILNRYIDEAEVDLDKSLIKELLKNVYIEACEVD